MTRTPPATLSQVAQRAGVSLTTASKAINGKDRVSELTRARVVTAARELSFTPNLVARGLMTGSTSTVGFIIADSMTHRFAAPVMLGAETALGAIDLSMITCDARGDQARSRELAVVLGARKVVGVLVVGDNNAVTASVTEYLDVLVVYVYGLSDDQRDVVHMPDDENGITLALDHLVAIGRRRIAHLTGPRGATAVVERVKGMRADAEGGTAIGRFSDVRRSLVAALGARSHGSAARVAPRCRCRAVRLRSDCCWCCCGLEGSRATGAGRRCGHRVRQLGCVRVGD